jgi:transposase
VAADPPQYSRPFLEFAKMASANLRLNVQITYLDRAVEPVSKNDERVARLRTVPRVGPVTAAAYVAAVDDAGRFAGANQVAAYLGLAPREMSSGEKGHKGRSPRPGTRT